MSPVNTSGHYDQDAIVSANNRITPDESTGSSIVTVIKYCDRIDANNAMTATTPTTTTPTTEHTSARDNFSRRSGTFEQCQPNDNNTNAIELSINKCIQATKSLSLQSNESPVSSSPPPSQSPTLNAIGSDKNHLGSGTKYTQRKNQFLNENREPCRIIIIKIGVFFKHFGHKITNKC